MACCHCHSSIQCFVPCVLCPLYVHCGSCSAGLARVIALSVLCGCWLEQGKPIEWADRSELLRARRYVWHDLLRVANAGIEDGEEELDVVPVPLVTHALRCAAVTGKFDQLVSRQLLLHAKPLAWHWQSRTKAQSNTQDATPPHRSRRRRRRRASQRLVSAGARGEVGGGAGDGGDSYDGGSSDSSIGSFPDDEAPIPGMDRSPGELIADSSRRFKELQDRVSTVIEKIHDDRVARVNAEAVLHAESQRASKSDPSVQDPAHRGTVRSPVVDTLDLSDMVRVVMCRCLEWLRC